MDHNADQLNSIVLPLMNVSRKMVNGLINKYEPHQVQIWISSASDKNTYAYDKTIEMLELAIMNPDKAYIMGCDYRVPLKCGLLPQDFLTELKTSPTFNELDFAKEYMSRFVGSSSEAWFNLDKIMRHRRIVNPEKREIVREGIDSFYIISVDIGRRKCQSVATVLKVFPNNNYAANLVNLFVLGKTEDEKFLQNQVLALKKIIADFNPREVVIDVNGIGIFFADEMVKPTLDPVTGITYPAYGFFNRDEYLSIQPRDCAKILYGLKANTQINSDMHSILYSKIDTGKLNFLIPEKDARVKLMATKVGQRMKPEEKVQRLMPHELTSILIDEIMNLRLKPTGQSNQVAVEEINKRMTKDKFSALEMGTYRVAQIQTAEEARRRNRGLGARRLTFFRQGGG